MSQRSQAAVPADHDPRNPGERIVALEDELARVRDAAARREQISLVIGVVAERYGLPPEQAWDLLVRVSQNANVRVHEVARLVRVSLCGRLLDGDRQTAHRVNQIVPDGAPNLIRIDPEESGGSR